MAVAWMAGDSTLSHSSSCRSNRFSRAVSGAFRVRTAATSARKCGGWTILDRPAPTSRRTATARSACGSSVRYGAPVPLRNAGSTQGAGAGSGRSPARKRQETPEDRRIDAHRVRCTVYVRPDWPDNVTAPWPSFEAGKTRRSSPSARTGSAKPAPPSAQSRCNPAFLLGGEGCLPYHVAVVWRVRRVGARDLGHLGVGQLPVEIVASLAIRRIRPVRNGSYGRLLYLHNDDCSLIFRYLSRHPRPDPPYARPCRDEPEHFPNETGLSQNLEPVSRRGACAPSR